MGKPGDGRTAPRDAGVWPKKRQSPQRAGKPLTRRQVIYTGIVIGLAVAMMIVLAVMPPTAPNDQYASDSDAPANYDMVGTLGYVVDGDTIRMVGGDYVRLALVDTPEINEAGGPAAKELIESICPVGSTVYLDLDDGQGGKDHYNRWLGIPYCNGWNLNEVLMDSGHGQIVKHYCHVSDFASESWAADCKR